MMKRVAIAETTDERPIEKLNRSRKYQTPAGMPPSTPFIEEALGKIPADDSTEMNSVVTKKSPKKIKNLATTDRRKKPSAAEIIAPNPI